MGWGPKAPDMSGANEAARTGAAISREQFDYWKNNIAPDEQRQRQQMIDIGERSYKLSEDNQVFQQGLARKFDDRFWNTQAPLQDDLLAENAAFDTEARRDELAGQANADVNSSFAAAREQQQRGLSRMGVNPGSGKALAMSNQMALAQAAAGANAQNKVRAAARAEGYGRKIDSNALLAGLPGFSSAANSAALGWNGNGQNAGSLGMDATSRSADIAGRMAGGAASGMQSASSNLRSNAIESAKSPGFDAAMGLIAGGMKMYGSMG